MKSLRLNPGLLPSTVTVPRSKSYANRALILAALAPQPITLSHLPTATDVTILLSALLQIGIKIQGSSSLLISGSFPNIESPQGATIQVGEGGTTARFLACLLLKGSAPYRLVLGARLKERPWEEFITQVQALGGKASLVDDLLTLQGPVRFPFSFEVDCRRTTQFATGLQLACGWSGEKVIPTNMDSSESYWDLTQSVISSFKANSSFEIPADWSSASYPLAFGALNQEINFPGLFYDQFQADAKFLDLLKKLGALEEHAEGIRVRPHQNSFDVSFDVSDCLDLTPALVFLLAHVKGEHIISGIRNLRHKESDRLQELDKLLRAFSRETRLTENSLEFSGSTHKCSDAKTLYLPDDHRMVMTAALFLKHHSGGVLSPIEAVNKSYPEFTDLLNV